VSAPLCTAETADLLDPTMAKADTAEVRKNSTDRRSSSRRPRGSPAATLETTTMLPNRNGELADRGYVLLSSLNATVLWSDVSCLKEVESGARHRSDH